ncbi:ATP-binding protein [Yinghuangia aomiensis]
MELPRHRRPCVPAALRRAAVLGAAPGPAAAGWARRRVRSQLFAWDLPACADVAELLVGELVTNALRHGRQPVTLRMARCLGGLVVEVSDSGAGLPLRQDRRIPTTSRDAACISSKRSRHVGGCAVAGAGRRCGSDSRARPTARRRAAYLSRFLMLRAIGRFVDDPGGGIGVRMAPSAWLDTALDRTIVLGYGARPAGAAAASRVARRRGTHGRARSS